MQGTRARADTERSGRALMLNFLSRLAPFAIVIALWQLVHTLGLVSPTLLPSPLDVIRAGQRLISRGELWPHVVASTLRVLAGVVIGVTLAVPVGFALGWYPAARRFFDPLLNFLRALPPIALVPLVVVYVGIGENGQAVRADLRLVLSGDHRDL